MSIDWTRDYYGGAYIAYALQDGERVCFVPQHPAPAGYTVRWLDVDPGDPCNWRCVTKRELYTLIMQRLESDPSIGARVRARREAVRVVRRA